MTSTKVRPDNPRLRHAGPGDAPATDITYVSHWVRGRLVGRPPDLLGRFLRTTAGSRTATTRGPRPTSAADIGTLGADRRARTLRARSTLPFIIAWHFPNVLNYFDVVPEAAGRRPPEPLRRALRRRLGRRRVSSSGTCAASRSRRRLFHDALFCLHPAALRDRRHDQPGSRHPKSTTCVRLAGRLFSSMPRRAAMPTAAAARNCTHVWNYEQSAGLPFPPAWNGHARDRLPQPVKPDGGMMLPHLPAARAAAPLGLPAAADGQMGRSSASTAMAALGATTNS